MNLRKDHSHNAQKIKCKTFESKFRCHVVFSRWLCGGDGVLVGRSAPQHSPTQLQCVWGSWGAGAVPTVRNTLLVFPQAVLLDYISVWKREKLSAMDVLARASMKDAARCDTQRNSRLRRTIRFLNANGAPGFFTQEHVCFSVLKPFSNCPCGVLRNSMYIYHGSTSVW